MAGCLCGGANLSQNIFVLRKALGDTPEDRRYIVTIPGRGYRFVAEVRTVAQDRRGRGDLEQLSRADGGGASSSLSRRRRPVAGDPGAGEMAARGGEARAVKRSGDMDGRLRP